MNRLLHATSTTIGQKYIVALTGLLLTLFVIVHMLGNLQIFLGPEALNAYARGLKGMPILLWGTRIGLFLLLIVHLGLVIRLSLRNRAARPIPYSKRKPVASTVSSRTMLLTGLVILAFVVYHLLHFTLGVTHPEHFALKDPKGQHDVYSMVVEGFRIPSVTLAYLVAQVLLAMHLAHGVGSFFQTLGWNQPHYCKITKRIGYATALFVLAGNTLMPLACWLHWLKLPGEVM